MSDPDIEELRQQSSPGQRSEAAGQSTSLTDALADELIAIDEGDASGQVAIRDSRLIALANTLDDRESDYEEIVSEVEAAVDSTPNLEEGTKAYLVALLARAGLQAFAGEHDEALSEAVSEYAQRTM